MRLADLPLPANLSGASCLSPQVGGEISQPIMNPAILQHPGFGRGLVPDLAWGKGTATVKLDLYKIITGFCKVNKPQILNRSWGGAQNKAKETVLRSPRNKRALGKALILLLEGKARAAALQGRAAWAGLVFCCTIGPGTAPHSFAVRHAL